MLVCETPLHIGDRMTSFALQYVTSQVFVGCIYLMIGTLA